MTVLATFTAAAQQQETVSVDITKLDANELQVYQKMKRREQEGKVERTLSNLTEDRIAKYAEIGKSFGIAFKECWTTVSNDAERFAQSPAGKWAMVLVSWKIMGQDAVNIVTRIVHFLAGGFLLICGVPFFIYIYRRNCTQYPLLVSKSKWGPFTTRKEYNGVNKPIHAEAEQWGYAFCFGVFVLICAMIMFIGG